MLQLRYAPCSMTEGQGLFDVAGSPMEGIFVHVTTERDRMGLRPQTPLGACSLFHIKGDKQSPAEHDHVVL
jgi:hypothetical protein